MEQILGAHVLAFGGLDTSKYGQPVHVQELRFGFCQTFGAFFESRVRHRKFLCRPLIAFPLRSLTRGQVTSDHADDVVQNKH